MQRQRGGAVYSPDATPVPNKLLDECLPEFRLSEVLVLLYLYRKTLGCGRESVELSLDELRNGERDEEGRRIDRGTGLATTSIIPAIGELERRGLITVERRRTESRGDMPNIYTIR
jgi:DNA-binding MarR family transcriptional regulator